MRMESFYRFADTNGDGSGSIDLAVDGSVTPVLFKLAPRSGERVIHVNRTKLHLVDTGTFDSGAFGNAIVLTNGITMGVYNAADDSLISDLLDGEVIITNADLGHVMCTIDLHTFGTGPQSMAGTWCFKECGSPIAISPDEYLGITIRDNLTGLNEFHFKFCGAVDYDV